MNIDDVKVGQKVKVVDQYGAFYGRHFNKTGTVVKVSSSVHVLFDHNGESDYGTAEELQLIEPVSATNLKSAIADVEKALAALKALVG